MLNNVFLHAQLNNVANFRDVRGSLSYTLPPLPDTMFDGSSTVDALTKVYTDFSATVDAIVAANPWTSGNKFHGSFLLNNKGNGWNTLSQTAMQLFRHAFGGVFDQLLSWGDQQLVAQFNQQALPGHAVAAMKPKPKPPPTPVKASLVAMLKDVEIQSAVTSGNDGLQYGSLIYQLPPTPITFPDGRNFFDVMNQTLADFDTGMQTAIKTYPWSSGMQAFDANFFFYYGTNWYSGLSPSAMQLFRHAVGGVFDTLLLWGDAETAAVTGKALVDSQKAKARSLKP